MHVCTYHIHTCICIYIYISTRRLRQGRLLVWAWSNTVGEGHISRRRYSRYGYIGPCCDGRRGMVAPDRDDDETLVVLFARSPPSLGPGANNKL